LKKEELTRFDQAKDFTLKFVDPQKAFSIQLAIIANVANSLPLFSVPKLRLTLNCPAPAHRLP
jgi:hypothetical protein